jgi:hypothetical protein
MPNVSSNGKFGTSMDYSQFLKIRKAGRLTAFATNVNPTNSPLIKQNFGRDYRSRGFTSGVVSTFNEKGLYLVVSRLGGGVNIDDGPV